MFIVIELQTNDEGQTANIVQTKDTKDEALSTFHSICASAAISSLRYHTAMVVDPQGRSVARECFEHITPVEEVAE